MFLWKGATVEGAAKLNHPPRLNITTDKGFSLDIFFMSEGKIELLINELTKMQEILNGRSEILRNKEGNPGTPGDVQKSSSELNV